MQKNDSSIIKILKVVIIVATIIIICVTGVYLYEIFTEKEVSFFSKHFALPIVFMVVGILAFLLPMANKENLRTDDRGDKMMPIIGILLFICAIFSCLMSFMTK